MTSDPETQKPIRDQVLDAMFKSLSAHATFDEATIEKLRQLADKGSLKKAPLVTAAIKLEPEANK